MNFNECMIYMDDVNEKFGISMGLKTITALLEKIGRPQDKTRMIHVAGTNGKGSVSTFIACILSEAGYKVGRYISPAVIDYCEKIQYINNGQVNYITHEEVSDYISCISVISEEMIKEGIQYPTPFEIETAMAFLAFKDWQCDFAIVECGMGGREDATNVIDNKEMCVFSTMSYDHTAYLGNTINEITANKAGILRKNVLAVSSPQCCEAVKELNKCAKENSTIIEYTEKNDLCSCNLEGSVFKLSGHRWYIPLLGVYQPVNAATAITAVRKMADKGIINNISDEIIQSGLKKAVWPRRLELVCKRPYIIIDGAHNPDGVKVLIESINTLFQVNKYRRIGIIGVFADKDVSGIMKYIDGEFDEMHTVTAPSKRAMSAEELSEIIYENCNIHAISHVEDNASQVMSIIKEKSDENTLIVVFGSLSLI